MRVQCASGFPAAAFRHFSGFYVVHPIKIQRVEKQRSFKSGGGKSKRVYPKELYEDNVAEMWLDVEPGMIVFHFLKTTFGVLEFSRFRDGLFLHNLHCSRIAAERADFIVALSVIEAPKVSGIIEVNYREIRRAYVQSAKAAVYPDRCCDGEFTFSYSRCLPKNDSSGRRFNPGNTQFGAVVKTEVDGSLPEQYVSILNDLASVVPAEWLASPPETARYEISLRFVPVLEIAVTVATIVHQRMDV